MTLEDLFFQRFPYCDAYPHSGHVIPGYIGRARGVKRLVMVRKTLSGIQCHECGARVTDAELKNLSPALYAVPGMPDVKDGADWGAPAPAPSCECGCEAVGSPGHSTWCPKFEGKRP